MLARLHTSRLGVPNVIMHGGLEEGQKPPALGMRPAGRILARKSEKY